MLIRFLSVPIFCFRSRFSDEESVCRWQNYCAPTLGHCRPRKVNLVFSSPVTCRWAPSPLRKLLSSHIKLHTYRLLLHCRFRSIAKSYFRKADGVLLLYDVTCETSYIDVRDWVEAIEVKWWIYPYVFKFALLFAVSHMSYPADSCGPNFSI